MTHAVRNDIRLRLDNPLQARHGWREARYAPRRVTPRSPAARDQRPGHPSAVAWSGCIVDGSLDIVHDLLQILDMVVDVLRIRVHIRAERQQS